MSKEVSVKPKFITRYASRSIPRNIKMNTLRRWCRIFGKKGLMPFYGKGSFGNMSFRTKGNSFVITASGIKDPSSKDSFVEVMSVDMAKKTVRVKGKKPPSSESMMHYLIYLKRKDVSAVFHGHSNRILNGYKKLGLPSTLKEEKYGTLRLAKSVLATLRKGPFIIMKDHGFLCVGKNMDSAGKRTLKVLKRP